MHLVLTNDDGYDAPGLAALWHAVRMLGFTDVQVIAPHVAYSCKGHTVSDEVRVHRRCVEPMGEILFVEGTPVDCVDVALQLEGQRRPAWLLSGINRGANLGVDQFNSGTVAAARQAAIHGVPSAAISQLVREPLADDWPRATLEAAAVLAALLRPGQPAPSPISPRLHAAAEQAVAELGTADPGNRGIWNINLPKLPADRATASVVAVTTSRDPNRIGYQTVWAADGTATLRYTGDYLARRAAPGTDVHAVFNDYISLTRLNLL